MSWIQTLLLAGGFACMGFGFVFRAEKNVRMVSLWFLLAGLCFGAGLMRAIMLKIGK